MKNIDLFWAVHRDKKRRDGAPQLDLIARDVGAESKTLPERLSDAIACCTPDPAEAERLRLQYLKDRA